MARKHFHIKDGDSVAGVIKNLERFPAEAEFVFAAGRPAAHRVRIPDYATLIETGAATVAVDEWVFSFRPGAPAREAVEALRALPDRARVDDATDSPVRYDFHTNGTRSALREIQAVSEQDRPADRALFAIAQADLADSDHRLGADFDIRIRLHRRDAFHPLTVKHFGELNEFHMGIAEEVRAEAVEKNIRITLRWPLNAAGPDAYAVRPDGTVDASRSAFPASDPRRDYVAAAVKDIFDF